MITLFTGKHSIDVIPPITLTDFPRTRIALLVPLILYACVSEIVKICLNSQDKVSN